MDYTRLREEPLKNAVRDDFFKSYKYTQLGNIDFVIAKHDTEEGQRPLFEDLDSSIASLPQNDGLSPEVQAVYDAGLELWWYYHAQSGADENASFYDIRKFF